MTNLQKYKQRISKNKALAKNILHITEKGLVLRGLCAKYFQPRKTKPMLAEVALNKKYYEISKKKN